MRIAQVKISNILGIKELELTPKGFNIISGHNGAGKTSVLEAIRAGLAGGHDATLLRKGEEKGEVVIVLDDETEIRKRVTERSSPLEVRQGGAKVPGASSYLKQLTDMLSVNPIDFLKAPKKDRTRVLLETMPIRVDAARLEEISGIPVVVGSDDHGLAVIESVRKAIYDDRTGTNRAVKEKDATINQLKLAMPEAVDGIEGGESELRSQLSAITEAKDTMLSKIQSRLGMLETEHANKMATLRADAQERINEINRQLEADLEAERTAATDFRQRAEAKKRETLEQYQADSTPINSAIASIVNNRENHAKREQAMATIKQMEQELEALEQDAKRQSEALDDIDNYKEELLSGLPIPGLAVQDGEVLRNGIPFDRLNTAQQVDIAVEIAKLRAGDLKVICVDGLELLDPEAFENFRDRAIESGLQLFVTKVTDQEFTTEAFDDV